MHLNITHLGDQAVLIYWPDEAAAVRAARRLRLEPPTWLQDIVPAYSTVGIYFDRARIEPKAVVDWLNQVDWSIEIDDDDGDSRIWTIPVCYGLQLDMSRIIERTGLDIEEIITLHTCETYTVHAIGFVPGFPYLCYLPKALQGVTRLPNPRTRVEAGSVGLTGKQTGIYPLERPGGWNIIGKTPLTIVDVEDEFFPLNVGDQVQFQRIDAREYDRLLGQRI